MGWHPSGVRRARIRVIGVNLSEFFIKGKGIEFEVVVNSSYPSSSKPSKNDLKVVWNPREMGQSDLQFELAGSSRYPSSSYRGVRDIRVWVIGEFALSEFELSGSSRYSTSTYRGSTVLLLFNTEIKSGLKIG